MPKPLQKHVTKTITPAGKVLLYFRVGKGPRKRLPDDPSSHEFDMAYAECLASKPKPRGKNKGSTKTIQWLVERYMSTGAWKALSDGTRRQRSYIFKAVVKENGSVPFAAINSKHIRNGMDKMAETPVQANNYLKALSGMFGWALKQELVKVNPCVGVDRLNVKSNGFPAWTMADAMAFRGKWPEGTSQRLAFEILLHVGSRRGDITEMGKQHLTGNILRFRTQKTGTMVTVELPDYVLDLIDRTKTGDMHFIITSHGKPFSTAGFGNWFGSAARAAGIEKNSHGIRKLSATIAADEGATSHELMAQFGWASPKLAEVYTKGADREKLGKRSSKRIAERVMNEITPTFENAIPKRK